MDFVLPPLLWLGVGKRSLPFRILNWTIVVGYSGIAIAGAAPAGRVTLRCFALPCTALHCWAGSQTVHSLCRGKVCCLLQAHWVKFAFWASAGRRRASSGVLSISYGASTAQVPSGQSKPSMRTWRTTTSSLTYSKPALWLVSRPAALCQAGNDRAVDAGRAC